MSHLLVYFESTKVVILAASSLAKVWNPCPTNVMKLSVCDLGHVMDEGSDFVLDVRLGGQRNNPAIMDISLHNMRPKAMLMENGSRLFFRIDMG